METVQIYDLVNAVVKQSIGETALAVIDTSSLVAMGQVIINSTKNTENFVNTLVQRIGRTIISYRKYNNALSGIVFDNMEWGAIVQKIKVAMPDMAEDKSFDLVDGQSVDQWIVNKPKVKQTFFTSRTPYSCYITVQEWQLKEAFTNEASMGAFISAIYGEVQNKLELCLEDLGRLCIANFIGHTAGTTQQVHLVTEYKTASGKTTTNPYTDQNFLRFAVGRMNRYKKKLTSMSVQYNTQKEKRHTPIKMQKFAILDDFETALETEVLYAAFNKEYVETKSNIAIPYWQAEKTPDAITLSVLDQSEDGEITTKPFAQDKIVAFLFDRDALGCFRKEEAVLTTPVNARGRYTNTFWHEQQMWFNDTSENGIVFILD